MPIYEYKCKKCGYIFEQLQKISEKPLRTCPKCKKSGLAKLISNTSFQLKGAGWYVTDFKSKNNTDDKKNKSDECPVDKKKEGKKEAKTVEKPKDAEKK